MKLQILMMLLMAGPSAALADSSHLETELVRAIKRLGARIKDCSPSTASTLDEVQILRSYGVEGAHCMEEILSKAVGKEAKKKPKSFSKERRLKALLDTYVGYNHRVNGDYCNSDDIPSLTTKDLRILKKHKLGQPACFKADISPSRAAEAKTKKEHSHGGGASAGTNSTSTIAQDD